MTTEAYNGREIELRNLEFDAEGERHQSPSPGKLIVHPSNLELTVPIADPMLMMEPEFTAVSAESSQRQLIYLADRAIVDRGHASSTGGHEAVLWPFGRISGGPEDVQPGDEVCFRLANLFMSAEHRNTSRQGTTVWDETQVTLDGRQWRFVQVDDYEDLRQQKKHRTSYHTYDLMTIAQTGDTLSLLTNLAADICVLLQIATSARVAFFSRCVVRSGTLMHEEFWAVVPDTAYGQDILPMEDRGMCRTFLSAVWPTYQAVKTDLNLSLLVSLYVKSLAEQFSEMRFIAGSVLMEAFKHNYARNVAHHPQNRGGYFLKPDRTRYSFEELLVEAWNYYHMTPVTFSFIQTRNSVFHTGAPNVANFSQEVRSLHVVIRKLLLRLIAYNGDYLDIENRFARIPFVP